MKNKTGDRLTDNSLVVNPDGDGTKPTSDWSASTGVRSLDSFTPGPGWIVFEREERSDREGTILLAPRSEKDRRYRPTTAIVRKVGAPAQHGKNGVRPAPQLSVGDRVILNRFSGHDVEIGGVMYVIGTEDEVVLVIGPDDRLSEVA